MSGERKDNSGALFANDRQRPGKQDPTHNGQCVIGGVEYWIKAWVNETRDGKRYFGLRFEPKMAREQGAPANPPAKAPAAKPQQDDFNDDIPF